MSIVQVWDNEDQTIMHHIFKGWWTADDYQEMFETFALHVYNQPHTVHYIADFRKSDGLLGNLVGIAPTLERIAPPNLGLGVAVAASYQTEMVLGVARKVAPHVFGQLYFAASLPDARQIIWQSRARETAV